MRKATVSTAGPNAPTQHLGGFEIAFITREVTPVETSPDGLLTTLGQMLDNSLAKAIKEGREVQDVAFHFDTTNPMMMRALYDMYKDTHVFTDEELTNY